MKIYGADVPRQSRRTPQESGRYVREHDREIAQAKPAFPDFILCTLPVYTTLSFEKRFFFIPATKVIR